MQAVVQRRAPYLLLAAILVLDLTFLTRTYYWDGVLFSLNIEGVHRGELPFNVLFHPNHLLYSPLGYFLYSAALRAGFTPRAVTVLQVLNVFFSASATFLVYRLSDLLISSRTISLFCGILFAFGAIWWKFSTDADSYILCALLLLLVYRFLIQKPINLFGAGACHALAMLFHELSVFMYLPVIAAIALGHARSRTKRLWICVGYLAMTGCAVTIAYLLCYTRVDHRAYPNLRAWITSYASDSGFTHSMGQLLGSYLSSYLKLFAGGKLRFLHDYSSAPVVVALLLCTSALGWGVFQFLRPPSAGILQWDRRAVSILWCWLLSYAAFLAMWDPGSTFHKLFLWPAIVLLSGAYLCGRKSLNKYQTAFLSLALALAAWNFAAYIYPHSYDSADPVLTLARRINRELPKDATVYYRAFDPDDWYLDYFAPGRDWQRLPDAVDAVKKSGTVCFETTALAVMPRASDFSQKWELVNAQHNIRLGCWSR